MTKIRKHRRRAGNHHPDRGTVCLREEGRSGGTRGKEIDKTVEKAGQHVEKAGQEIQDAAKDAKK